MPKTALSEPWKNRPASPDHYPIMIVGEAWGQQEETSGKPFDGPTGSILFGLLRQAGIDKRDCYFTNVFNLKPPGNKIEGLCGPKSEALPNFRAIAPGKFIHRKYAPEIERLSEEISRARPNVIVACGNTALWALTKKVGIKRYRGSPLPTYDTNYKVIPTWAPSSIARQWELRPIVLSDLVKARRESTFPEIRRPVRYIYMEPSIEDIDRFFAEKIDPCPFISCDIETKMETITEVGIGTHDGKHAIVIPFYWRASVDGNYWPDIETEAAAWDRIARVLREKPVVGQNFAYDMKYFWQTMGITCSKFLGDTMIQQHSLQPEMEKGLGFLGSIYTNEPSWKFMRADHSTLKAGDD